MGEQLLSRLVGIHVGLLEHGIDVGVGVVADDLLDGLDGLTDPSGDHLVPALEPRATAADADADDDHLSPEIARVRGMGGRGATKT